MDCHDPDPPPCAHLSLPDAERPAMSGMFRSELIVAALLTVFVSALLIGFAIVERAGQIGTAIFASEEVAR